jgi:hypothetical protein
MGILKRKVKILQPTSNRPQKQKDHKISLNTNDQLNCNDGSSLNRQNSNSGKKNREV